jgi:probable F420-dependent oxidoreductase
MVRRHSKKASEEGANVKLGLVTFVTDGSIRPDELAQAAEQRGFESLFLCEHSNIPASRETPYPGGGPLPDEYYRTFDPFVALSWAASATSRIRIGTGMCILAQRDTVHTAKEVASLDVLSGGRFDFGIGAGWNVDEMRQHGVDPRQRTRLMREKLMAIKALWRDEVAEYRGDLVTVEPTTQRPAPAQRPHPPVIVGGMGPTVLDRVLEYGDAWAPNPGWPPMPDLPERLEQLAKRAEAMGRGPVPVHIFGVTADAEQVERYEELGVDSCVLLLPTLPQSEALAALDDMAKLLG